MLERADSLNVKTGVTPVFPGVILTATDGSSWQLTVAPDGSIATIQVV
jgi:hypothetical protein